MVRRIRYRFHILLSNLFIGGRAWGAVRLFVVILLVIFFSRLDLRLVAGIDKMPLTSYQGMWLRFFYLPVVAWLCAMVLGALYIQDVYELPRVRSAIRYLIAALYGLRYSRLAVKNGQEQLKEDEINTVDIIGGPGYAAVDPGNVVLLERASGPTRVFGQGGHLLLRGETIKELASLEDQHGFIENVSATTKDGIGVTVRDVNYRFRLRAGRKPGDYARRTPAEPFPYSVEAVRNMAYNRMVSTKGVGTWQDAVESAVKGVITDYIYQHKVDPLTTPKPNENDPRAEIRNRFKSRVVRERFKNIGTDLLWIDIGNFEVPDQEVVKQRIATWAAKWEGDVTIERVHGEAQRIYLQEVGRAQAQAMILENIVDGLKIAGLAHNPKENLRKIVLLRTAQFLEAYTEHGHVANLEDLPPDIKDKKQLPPTIKA
jgi:hypothetical protein